MTEEEIAENKLRTTPGYTWLINDNKAFWTPQELEKYLGFSAQTIRRWVEAGAIPGALDFGATGIRIPRAGLIIYLANNLVQK